MLQTFIFTFTLITLAFSQYDFSLEDINSTSETFGEMISPGTFTGQVTLHYFGHQN